MDLPEQLSLRPAQRSFSKRTVLRWGIILCLCQGLAFALPQCAKRDEGLKTAPDFTLKSLAGEEVSLSSMKGKVIFVDFWATWCGPCRESIPHLVNLYKNYREKGFQIIGASVDKTDPDQVRRFASSLEIPYPIVIAPSDLEKSYGVTGLPTGFLIDKNGKIRDKFIGFSPSVANQLDSKVQTLLSEP